MVDSMLQAICEVASHAAHTACRSLFPTALLNALRRRLTYQALNASALFDKHWYLAHQLGVDAAGVDPVWHYINVGAAECRNPSPQFDTRYYLARYPDVAAANVNPLRHYLKFGWRETRLTRPEQFFDLAASQDWRSSLCASAAASRVRQRQPLVSIILPTRDRARLLPNAIDSITAQTYTRWQLIIIDDGSTDGTADLVTARYPDSRIKLLHTQGQGVCHARNTGLNHALGDALAYLDSDNTWTPQYLELMLYELERSDADCAYAALEVNDGMIDGTTIRPWYRHHRFDYDELKQSNYIDMNVFMHKKSLFDELGGFDTTLRRMVDWDLVLRYCRDHPAAFANFVGASYDNGHAADRISNREGLIWGNVIRNRYLIDWKEQAAAAPRRDPDLVSVVICVCGSVEITETCLRSLYTHEPGCRMELIVVDNGRDTVSAQRLGDWKTRDPDVVLIHNRESYHFALGCNLGFAASNGACVVWLRGDIEVTPGWLRALVHPLRDPAILGARPRLLHLDEPLGCGGSDRMGASSVGYSIHSSQPDGFTHAPQPRGSTAVTAVCLATRAGDFAHAKGFDPLCGDGHEGADLWLRLGHGRPVFRYVPDSLVLHRESNAAA